MRKIQFKEISQNLCLIKLFLVNFLDYFQLLTESSENIYYKINETNIDDYKFDTLFTEFKKTFNKFICSLEELSEKQLTNSQSIFYMKITESSNDNYNYKSNNLNQDKVIDENFNYDIWELSRSRVFNKICFELNNGTEYVFESPRFYLNYHKTKLNLTCKIIKNFNENDVDKTYQIIDEIDESLNYYTLNNKIIIFGKLLSTIKSSTNEIKTYIENILNELQMIDNSYKIINL